MTETYSNVVASERMLTRLKLDPNFRVEELSDSSAVIPIVAWRLWVRATGKTGQMEIIKGPHYQYNDVSIADAVKSSRSRFFRIESHLVCIVFSKDIDFDPTQRYKIDLNYGEIFVCPAFIDEVGPLGTFEPRGGPN